MRQWFVSGLWVASLIGAIADVAYAGLPVAYDASYISHKVVIPKLSAPEVIDTDLTRLPWKRAAVLTGNLDWRRVRTAVAPLWTYLFYDDEALWVACRNNTKPGPQLRCNAKKRDDLVRKDDDLEVWLDVGPRGGGTYRFMTNSAGVLYDAYIIDKSYTSNTTVQTSVDDEGWTAVMRIPFADLDCEKPIVGSRWAFNVAFNWVFNVETLRSGDNCWAPVLGGYHIPEQFATLVFGESQAPVIQMREFQPILVGGNRVVVKSPPKTRYVLAAIDNNDRAVWRDEGLIGSDGKVDFTLTTDQIHHVNYAFMDAEGNELLTFWRPMDSPAFLHKLPGLKADAEIVRGALDRLPGESRAKVKAVLNNVDHFFIQPIEKMYERWEELAKQVASLERRVCDAKLFCQTLNMFSLESPYALALATPVQKVMIKDFPCPGIAAKRYDLSLARNEHEALQVVVIPYRRDLKNVLVAVSAPKCVPGGSAFIGDMHVSLVGHVMTVPAGSNVPDYVGWYPDLLIDYQQRCDVAVGEHVAFWVDVATRKDTKADDYQSTITVTADDCDPVTVDLRIGVRDFALPDGTHLGNAFTYKEENTKRLYKKRWSKELAYKYYDFFLDHRLNIDQLYGKGERDIEMLQYGVKRGMSAFNILFAGRGSSAPKICKMLDERMPALKAAGLDDKAYLYGFDEVNDDVFPKMKEVFGAVHDRYPNLPRMTTGYDNTFGQATGLRDYVDIWVPLIPRYNMDEAKKLRAEGKDMWWYLCSGPREPFPNWFVESPTIQTRLLMGAMSYKYQAGGVLYFMTNQWKKNDKPVGMGPYTTWSFASGKGTNPREGYANGDGILFAAGPNGPMSTIRFENIRDGLEDYEYLYYLAELVEAVEKQPATAQRLDFLERARALLAVPDQVVTSSSRYTCDPQELYALRTRLADAIEEGSRLAK